MKRTFSFSGSKPAWPSHCLRQRQMCPCWIGCQKKNPHNYIQPLPELSHFACVIQERSSLVTRLPEDKLPLELRGWNGNGMNAFSNCFPPKYFSNLSFCIFFLCNISLDARESSTWNKLSLWMLQKMRFSRFEGLGEDDCNGPTLISSHFAKIKCKCIHEPWWHHVEPKSNNSLFIIIIVICIEDRCWVSFLWMFHLKGFFFFRNEKYHDNNEFYLYCTLH